MAIQVRMTDGFAKASRALSNVSVRCSSSARIAMVDRPAALVPRRSSLAPRTSPDALRPRFVGATFASSVRGRRVVADRGIAFATVAGVRPRCTSGGSRSGARRLPPGLRAPSRVFRSRRSDAEHPGRKSVRLGGTPQSLPSRSFWSCV